MLPENDSRIIVRPEHVSSDGTRTPYIMSQEHLFSQNAINSLNVKSSNSEDGPVGASFPMSPDCTLDEPRNMLSGDGALDSWGATMPLVMMPLSSTQSRCGIETQMGPESVSRFKKNVAKDAES